MTHNNEIQQAKQAYKKKEYRRAAELFARIAAEIPASEDILLKAEMYNNSSVAWLQAGEAQQALDAVLGTDAIFADAGDTRRQSMALGNQAAAYEALGQYEKALELYNQASELMKEIDDEDLRAYILQNIAALQLRSGDQLQSMASMHTALENKKKLSSKEKFLKRLLRIPFKLMR